MTEQLVAATTIGGALVLWFGWIKAIRPRLRAAGRMWRKLSVFVDTFTGREESVDEATGTLIPAVVPLHLRLGGIERTQADQAAALKALAQHMTTQTELVRIAADHEARLLSLEDVEAERSLTREESAAMWRAVDNRDVVDAAEQESP